MLKIRLLFHNSAYCVGTTISVTSWYRKSIRQFPLLSHMPFQKNFPALGTTTRLRIPEKIAPHFESVLEHLNRQVRLLGQDYIEAFFAQCLQAMKQLESASTSSSNTPLEELNHQELKKHFVAQYMSQAKANRNKVQVVQKKIFPLYTLNPIAR